MRWNPYFSYKKTPLPVKPYLHKTCKQTLSPSPLTLYIPPAVSHRAAGEHQCQKPTFNGGNNGKPRKTDWAQPNRRRRRRSRRPDLRRARSGPSSYSRPPQEANPQTHSHPESCHSACSRRFLPPTFCFNWENKINQNFDFSGFGFQEGKDVVARAKTGSGKTFAYLVPLLQKLFAADSSSRSKLAPSAFVLVPTRELCQQVCSFSMS